MGMNEIIRKHFDIESKKKKTAKKHQDNKHQESKKHNDSMELGSIRKRL